jgi:hypothetical protein
MNGWKDAILNAKKYIYIENQVRDIEATFIGMMRADKLSNSMHYDTVLHWKSRWK